jgi:hypothetical protein
MAENNPADWREPFCCEARMSVGRCLAYCAHPAAAWRRLSGGGRVLLLSAYFGASYLLTLVALLVI